MTSHYRRSTVAVGSTNSPYSVDNIFEHAECHCCHETNATFININEAYMNEINKPNTYWTESVMIAFFSLLDHVVLQHKGGIAIDFSFLIYLTSSTQEMENAVTKRLQEASTILVPVYVAKPNMTHGHYVLFLIKKEESKIVVYESLIVNNLRKATHHNELEVAIRRAGKK